MKKEFKPIAMKCTQEQFNAIKPILEANGGNISLIESFKYKQYLVNNLGSEINYISNLDKSSKNDKGRTVFEEWNQDIFLEYCGIEKPSGYKLVVPATDVLEIHKIACNKWKHTIKCKYLSRISLEQNITFTEKEVDEMFESATSEQKPILTRIFGEKKKEIDFDKLKTGSRVMIKDAGEVCSFTDIDYSKPVDIVFYRTPYCLDNEGFCNGGFHSEYITFSQGGELIVYSSCDNINYITEVIEY